MPEIAVSDVIPFFRAWVSDPLRVASVVPSSRALANAITREIGASTGPVIELGPGTGVFTRALLARGVPPSKLALVERGEDFSRLLQLRFPTTKVVCTDATLIRHIDFFDGEKPGAVVSGLPLLSMSVRQVIAILNGVFHHLRTGGAFYQFTYGPRCPVPRRVLDRLGLEAVRTGWVLNNFPPAQVYRISRRLSKNLLNDLAPSCD